jgi:hypothetical protein
MFQKIAELSETGRDFWTTKTIRYVKEEVFGLEVWRAFKELFLREWWMRIWVVQEVAVATEALLICGQDHIRSHRFNQAILCLKTLALLRRRREGLQEDIDEDLQDIIQVETGLNDNHSLLYFVNKYRSRLSTDPRDKIYALLGLANNVDVFPDYSLSVREVFQKFTEACIRKSGTLDILNFVSISSRGDIPSWVPDWSAVGLQPLIDYESPDRIKLFSASGTSTADFITLAEIVDDHSPEDPGICSFSGFMVDTIASMGDTHADFGPVTTLDSLVLQQWVSMFDASINLDSPYKTNEARFDAFWKTLMAGTDHGKRIGAFTQVYRNLFRQWLFREPWEPHPNYAEYIEIPDFVTSFRQAAIGRRFFVTEKGYMGLAPHCARLGDLVCVLLGGQTPFILREMEDMTSPERLQEIFGDSCRYFCCLVGECYIHGLMDGEVFIELEANGDTLLETFAML